MISYFCFILAVLVVPIVTSFETTPDSQCLDRDIYCKVLFNSEFCKQNEFVQRQCPRTCQMCYKFSTPQFLTSAEPKVMASMSTPITTRSSTLMTVTTGITQCFDKDPDCFTLAQTDYCTKEIAKEMCAATCHFCENNEMKTTHEQLTTEKLPITEVTSEMSTIEITNEMSTTPESTNEVTSSATSTEEISTETTSELLNSTSNRSTVTVTTVLPTLPSLKPFVPNVHNCFDKDSKCSFLAGSPFCDKDPLVPRVCPVSCGHCVNTTSYPTASPAPHCIDLDPSCDKLHNISHYCDEFASVRNLCPKACHLCMEGTSPTPQTPDCTDYDPQCPSLRPFCESREFVRKLCPKACGVCPASTTAATPSPSALSQLTTSSTTTKSPYIQEALSCRTCENPFCEMGIEADHECPDHAPFCMNIVGRDKHDIPTLTKRCASKRLCEERWLNGSALSQECLNLDFNFLPEIPFECTFCCVTPECNFPAVPRQDTLYTSHFSR